MARWELVSNEPTIRRSLFGCCTFNDRIFIAGGVRGSTRFGDVWAFDGTNWERTAPDNTILPRRDSCTLIVHDNHLWLLGGWDGTNYLNDVWRSPNGTNWERVDRGRNPFTARDDHNAWSHDNRIWVGCGDNGGGSSLVNELDVSYDGFAGNWRTLVTGHGYLARTDAVGVTFDNRMFTICGINGTTRQSNAAYSADGMNWNQTPDTCGLPSAASMGGCVYNNKIVVSGGVGDSQVGGGGSGNLGCVYYSANGMKWKYGGPVRPNVAGWSRYNHRMASLKNPNRCYIIFGYDPNASDSSGEVWVTQDQFSDHND